MSNYSHRSYGNQVFQGSSSNFALETHSTHLDTKRQKLKNIENLQALVNFIEKTITEVKKESMHFFNSTFGECVVYV